MTGKDRITHAGPYRSRTAALATQHGKERVVARPLWAALGLIVTVPAEINTDLLGTFAGDVKRTGTPREVVIRKARLGMSASGINQRGQTLRFALVQLL